MKTTHSILVVLAALLLPAACGDTPEPIDIDPSTCKPNSEAGPKDCDITTLPEVDEDGRVTSAAGVKAICQSRCTNAKDLRIENIPGLHNLNGFRGVTSIDRDLDIMANPQLETLKGLDIQDPPQGIRITQNPQLKSLKGLSNIERLGFQLQIEDNPKLTNLQGLNNLRGFEHDSSISGITLMGNGLKNLKGLENLRMEGGQLYIQSEGNLTSLEGLGSLGKLNNLKINHNESLSSVEALSGLEKIGYGFQITENPSLPSCLAEDALEDVETPPDADIRIRDNGGYDYPVCDSSK